MDRLTTRPSGPHGSVERYKARLVAKGYSQRPGFDYLPERTFSPTPRLGSIRSTLARAAIEDRALRSVDISHAFINGELEEEIYMQQPEGFAVKGKEDFVCKLKKSLYGLKQAPREWYHKFDTFMKSQGFGQSDTDYCLYNKRVSDGSLLILIL